MKDSNSMHPLAWLAVALGAVAVVTVVVVGGLIYVARWLSSNAMAFNNPAYMSLIVAGALVGGFTLAGAFLILHDAVDAWGDAYKTKAAKQELTDAEIERAAAMAKIRGDHAKAAKDEAAVVPALPPWDDGAAPWPTAENGGPKEFGG